MEQCNARQVEHALNSVQKSEAFFENARINIPSHAHFIVFKDDIILRLTAPGIPPRTTIIVLSRTSNNLLLEGYVTERISGEVFISNTLVRNINGTTYIVAINRSVSTIEIKILVIDLKSVDGILEVPSEITDSRCISQSYNVEANVEQTKQLRSLPNFDNLNQQKREHVFQLIYEYPELFYEVHLGLTSFKSKHFST